jgi:large subunit ribosomal protein L7e
LKTVEDYIAYGHIPLRIVEELIHRRAFVVENGGKRALSDNLIVEEKLGEHNILCLADLIHEIYNVGEHFDDALKILAPFTLSAPVGGFEQKQLRNTEDERHFLGDKMEEFLNKIL